MSSPKLFLIALLSWGSATLGVEPLSFDLSRTDTQAHLALSYSLALSGTVVLERYEIPRWKAVLIASAVTLGLGGVKELALDKEPSLADLFADTLGVGLSAGLVFSFDL
jgi:hypothetical protein